MSQGLPPAVPDHIIYSYYDGLGRTYKEASSGPDGKTIIVNTTFDSLGRVYQKSRPYFDGAAPVYTTFTYDGLSRVVRVTRPDGGYTATGYHGLEKDVGVSQTNSNVTWTTYTYDVHKRLRQTKDHDLTITQYTYDTLGNLKTIMRPNPGGGSVITTMAYDSLSKKVSMSDPDMGAWDYRYDKAGNLVCQRDAKGQAIGFEYDEINRTTAKNYYSGATCTGAIAHNVTYTYDTAQVAGPQGNSTAYGVLSDTRDQSSGEDKRDQMLTTDVMLRPTKTQKTIGAEIVTLSKTYDSAGKVASITYFPDDASRRKLFTYGYDVAGNLLSLQESSGMSHVLYSNYTALGQPGLSVFPKTNSAVTSTYTYDPATARLKTLVTQTTDVQDGWSQLNTRDPINMAVSGSTLYATFATYGLWQWNGTTWNQLNYQDPANMAAADSSLYATFTGAGVWQWNGTTWSQLNTRDPVNMVASGTALYASFTGYGLWKQSQMSGNTAIQDLTYTYDLKGNIKTVNDAVNGIYHTYNYDLLDRLTDANGAGTNGYAESYTYDALGNIKSKSGVGAYSPNYSTKPHTINTAGSYSFTYDENGNMLTKNGPANPLNITWNEDNKPSSVNSIQFTYDGHGNRIRKSGFSTVLYFGDAYERRGAVGM